MGFALAKLVTRRTWRMPPWEGAQVGLGLAIPFLLIGHILANRGLNIVADYEDVYQNVLLQLWPGAAWRQSLLLLVVWLHAMIGLHHWLRIKPWYARWTPALLAFAVLVPTLALTGWIEGARRVATMGFGPPLTEGRP
jgi:adenylate cyclase